MLCLSVGVRVLQSFLEELGGKLMALRDAVLGAKKEVPEACSSEWEEGFSRL